MICRKTVFGWRRETRTHLKHYTANLVDALSDCIRCSGEGHGTFRRVWQHLAGHLNRASGHLADLLDFRPALACEEWEGEKKRKIVSARLRQKSLKIMEVDEGRRQRSLETLILLSIVAHSPLHLQPAVLCLSNGILTESEDNLSADEGKVASPPSDGSTWGIFLSFFSRLNATFSSFLPWKEKASRQSELSRGRSSSPIVCVLDGCLLRDCGVVEVGERMKGGRENVLKRAFPWMGNCWFL